MPADRKPRRRVPWRRRSRRPLSVRARILTAVLVTTALGMIGAGAASYLIARSQTLDGIRNHSWSRPSPATPEGAVVSWADRCAYSAHDLEDAVQAGIVSPSLLPPIVAERLGPTRSRQLHRLVSGMIESITTTGVAARVDATPGITRRAGWVAIDLLTLSHNSDGLADRYEPLTCFGAYVLDTATGETVAIVAKKTILATGGLGQIFLHTTNVPGSVGHGVAMAYRVGARLIDLEYVQFHPTVFAKKNAPRFLVTEAKARLDLVGKAVPVLSACDDVQGKAVRLGEYRGKWLLLDFWSASGSHWVENLPALQTAHAKLKTQGLEILGVNMGETREEINDFVQTRKVAWRQVQGASASAETFAPLHITTLPANVLIDPSGKIVRLDVRPANLEAVLKGLLETSRK